MLCSTIEKLLIICCWWRIQLFRSYGRLVGVLILVPVQCSQYREPSFGHGTFDALNNTHARWYAPSSLLSMQCSNIGLMLLCLYTPPEGTRDLDLLTTEIKCHGRYEKVSSTAPPTGMSEEQATLSKYVASVCRWQHALSIISPWALHGPVQARSRHAFATKERRHNRFREPQSAALVIRSALHQQQKPQIVLLQPGPSA